ncbi:hypothetical protein BKA66DRAFT_470844 [Pyrenochaeta sp. MPI-SDFR-AT-0127]|nr:hypothetical protein BKA66DRAFT_470844 [Pyrenochaeta sp. MPI-SDFR-AT-0127]
MLSIRLISASCQPLVCLFSSANCTYNKCWALASKMSLKSGTMTQTPTGAAFLTGFSDSDLLSRAQGWYSNDSLTKFVS